MKLLFIGDIVGKPGREIVGALVAKLRTERGLDFVIADGENAAAGSGITGAIAKTLLEGGVDAVTLGDHVWDQKGFETEIVGLERVCRPANLPAINPGRDHLIIEKNGFRLLIFTVLGRTFMGLKAECPFLCADEHIQAEKCGKLWPCLGLIQHKFVNNDPAAFSQSIPAFPEYFHVVHRVINMQDV